MSRRDRYEPGVPCFVATIQPDPRAAAGFYAAVFGWAFDEGEIRVARLRGKPVAAVTPLPPNVEPPPSPAWITDVAVASADEAAAKAEAAGGQAFAPTATMFRLPGQVGGEPRQPVSREVVATMMRGERAAWTVDFWVDDVDAAAATATERGGSVIAGPFDNPLGRQAVLADPAGVPFSITRIAQAEPL